MADKILSEIDVWLGRTGGYINSGTITLIVAGVAEDGYSPSTILSTCNAFDVVDLPIIVDGEGWTAFTFILNTPVTLTQGTKFCCYLTSNLVPSPEFPGICKHMFVDDENVYLLGIDNFSLPIDWGVNPGNAFACIWRDDADAIIVQSLTNGTLGLPVYGDRFMTGDVFNNSYLSLPEKPINPTPEHEQSEFEFDGTLSWEDGGGATSYNVYVGIEDDLTLVSEGQEALSFILNANGIALFFYIDPETHDIVRNNNCYWRVDATNNAGTTEGDVWWFNPKPNKTENPTPADEVLGITLDWEELLWEYNEWV